MSNIHQIRKDLCKKFHGNGVEVGVCFGEFSQYILKENSNVLRLYSVDSWRHWGINPDANDVSDFEHACRARTAIEGLTEFRDRSVVIRSSSEIASELFKDHSLDFVYLDAGHDFDTVTRDLQIWWPKVKAGGLICGDDFVDGAYRGGGLITHFGVKSAVEQFFQGIKAVNSDPVSENHEYLPQWWVHA